MAECDLPPPDASTVIVYVPGGVEFVASMVNVVEKGAFPEAGLKLGIASLGRPNVCRVTGWSNSPTFSIVTMNTAGSSPRKTDLSFGEMDIEKSEEVSVVVVEVAFGDGGWVGAPSVVTMREPLVCLVTPRADPITLIWYVPRAVLCDVDIVKPP